ARFLLAKDREDLLDLFVVDDLAQTDLVGLVGRNHQCQIAVRETQHEVLVGLAECFLLLPALDHGRAMVGVDDLVTDVKRHSSPKNGTERGRYSKGTGKREVG